MSLSIQKEYYKIHIFKYNNNNVSVRVRMQRAMYYLYGVFIMLCPMFALHEYKLDKTQWTSIDLFRFC